MRLKKIVYLCHLTLRLFELTDLFITPKVRYKGAKAQIPAKVIIVTGINAFAKASFIMFQKIANVLSIVSFLMVTSVIGGGYFGYKYVTSENFKTKLMNEVLEGVSGMMPKVLDKGLPKMTGESMPIPKNFGI
jgi:hypothetical protein